VLLRTVKRQGGNRRRKGKRKFGSDGHAGIFTANARSGKGAEGLLLAM
jgi:hypothetical protein